MKKLELLTRHLPVWIALVAGVATAGSIMTGCSLAPSQGRVVRIPLPGVAADSARKAAGGGLESQAITAVPSPSPSVWPSPWPTPTAGYGETSDFDSPPLAASFDDFTCYAVNVRGPGIADDPRLECAPGVIGKMAGFVPVSAGYIEVRIPEGVSREIELIATPSKVGCPSLEELLAARSADGGFKGIGEPYIVGRAKVDVLGDVDLTIEAAFDPAKPEFLPCGDGPRTEIGVPLTAAYVGEYPRSDYSPKPLSVAPAALSNRTQVSAEVVRPYRTDYSAALDPSNALIHDVAHVVGGPMSNRAAVQLWWDVTAYQSTYTGMRVQLDFAGGGAGSDAACATDGAIAAVYRGGTGNWSALGSTASTEISGQQHQGLLSAYTTTVDGRSYVVAQVESLFSAQGSKGSCVSRAAIIAANLRLMLNPDSRAYVRKLVAAGSSTCALLTNGVTKCWGSNSKGSLGQGATWSSGLQVPTPVRGPYAPRLFGQTDLFGGISGSSAYFCSLVSDFGVERLQCWGSNEFNQLLDDAAIAEHPLPGGLIAGGSPVLPEWSGGKRLLALGNGHMCTLLAGKVKCWGRNDVWQIGGAGSFVSLPTEITLPGTSVSQLAAGEKHTCAVVDSVVVSGVTYAGPVVCWGDNSWSQCGAASGGPTLLPGPALAVVTGARHSCAISKDLDDVRRVYCWGSNDTQQLGVGTAGNFETPQLVAGLTNVTELVAGADFTCAAGTMSSGGPLQSGIYCWGNNLNGQLGTAGGGTSATPVAIPIGGVLRMPRSLVAGAAHACALMPEGSVYCWGNNYSGQTGGATFANQPTAAQITNLALTYNPATPPPELSSPPPPVF